MLEIIETEMLKMRLGLMKPGTHRACLEFGGRFNDIRITEKDKFK